MPLSTRLDPTSDLLLRARPEAERCWLQPQLARIALRLGQVPGGPGMPLTHVHFPTTGIVPLLSVMEDGDSIEAAAAGPQGMVGVGADLGGGAVPGSAVVHTAGWGWRLPAETLAASFARSPAAVRLLLRCTRTPLTHVTQTAACTRHHALHQQRCRWLLLSLDRLRIPELVMTHARMAQLPGVRRKGVMAAALRLQRTGLVHHPRGRIPVLDRSGITQRGGGCYAATSTICRPLSSDGAQHTTGVPQ